MQVGADKKHIIISNLLPLCTCDSIETTKVSKCLELRCSLPFIEIEFLRIQLVCGLVSWLLGSLLLHPSLSLSLYIYIYTKHIYHMISINIVVTE